MTGDRFPCVYILASCLNGTLYVGVTSDLVQRMVQHRSGEFDGFTKRYAVKRLVFFEAAETMADAIGQEKRLKRYRRDWKRNLIERNNPCWDDLAVSLGLPPLAWSPVARWIPAQGRDDVSFDTIAVTGGET